MSSLEAFLPLYLLLSDDSFKFTQIFIAIIAVERLWKLPALAGCFKVAEMSMFVYLFAAWTRHLDAYWPRFFLLAGMTAVYNPVLLVFMLPMIRFAEVLSLILRDWRLVLLWIVQLCGIAVFTLQAPTHLPTNALRKIYHLAALCLFLPAFYLNWALLRLAFAFAALLAFALEWSRCAGLIKSAALDAFMLRCRSERDTGALMLSHLYLLIGCAFPVWLNECNDRSGLAGIISLGLGDSVAALVGRRWGHHALPYAPSKSVEGTMAGAGAMCLAFLGAGMSVRGAVVVAGGAAMWESVAGLNDNLSLPLVTMYLIKRFG